MSCVCPIPYRSPQARQPLPVALIVLPEPEHPGSSTLPPSWAPAALLQFQRSTTTRLIMSAKLDNPIAYLPNSTTQFNMFNLSANLSLLSVTSVDSFLRSLTQMESGALVVVVDMSLAVLRLLVDLIHPK